MRSKREDWYQAAALGEKDVEDSCGKQEFIGSQLPRDLYTALFSRSSEIFTCVLSLFFCVALSQATHEGGVSMV